MIRILNLMICFTLIASSGFFAQDEETDDWADFTNDDWGSSSTSYELRGNIRTWFNSFMSNTNSGMDIIQTMIKTELVSTLSSDSAFKILGYYVYDGISGEGEFILQEAYADYYSTHLDLRIGKQVFSWGKADELNPTDVLSPQDFSNLLEDKIIRKKGKTALKATLKSGNYFLEGVWLPEFASSNLADPGTRWSPIELPPFVTALPDPTMPENSLENSEYAIRFGGTVRSYDFTVSYADLWDNFNTVEIALGPMPVIQLDYRRSKMLGADFATAFGEIGFWGEAAYFITEDTDGVDDFVKNPYIEAIVGGDYTIQAIDTRVSVQYYQEFITKIDSDIEEERELATISKMGIGLPISQALNFRIEKKFGEGQMNSFSLLGIWDLKDNGNMMQPKLSLKPVDALLLELGAGLFWGEEASTFGKFTDNDCIYLRTTYSF